VRYVIAALVALTANLNSQTAPQEFAVATIKRNVSADASTAMRSGANGQQDLINVTARTLIGQGFPSRGSNQIIGLPSWAETDRYDVIVKADRRRPRDEQVPMWRALLADRMKLTAHYEPREEAIWDLVFARADHRLGPRLKPSTCTPRTEAPTTRQLPCGFSVGPNRLSIGPTTLVALARVLQGEAGRLVVDKTGLVGEFDVDLSFSPRQLGVTPAADDAPDFFTALQEQLGLKLESSRAQVEVLVIDHIERPTEN
jgi:uncharacterized protein (TIGR03435 family)